MYLGRGHCGTSGESVGGTLKEGGKGGRDGRLISEGGGRGKTLRWGAEGKGKTGKEDQEKEVVRKEMGGGERGGLPGRSGCAKEGRGFDTKKKMKGGHCRATIGRPLHDPLGVSTSSCLIYVLLVAIIGNGGDRWCRVY